MPTFVPPVLRRAKQRDRIGGLRPNRRDGQARGDRTVRTGRSGQRRHAVRRIRSVTRAPNRKADSGTRSSTAWNRPNASKSSGTRSGVNP